MTWLWIVLAIVALVVIVPFVIGARLDREHSCTVSADYPCPPQTVWETITGFDAMATWREGLQRVEVLEPVGGRRRVREHTGFGPMTYELEVEDAPRRLVTRIVDTDKGFGGSWTFEIRPATSGNPAAGDDTTGRTRSELRITENGFVDNLLFRFLARCFLGHDATLRAYHRGLRRRLGDASAGEPDRAG